MEVSREDFQEFVSLLSEDDEDDRAMLEVLEMARKAYADPEVLAAIEAQQQRQGEDDAMLERARSEGRAARLSEPSPNPDALAEEYAKLTMEVWENENPANYPEPPWDEFARDQKVSDLQEWNRAHERRVAERYFRASGLYHGMVRSFLEGYNESEE